MRSPRSGAVVIGATAAAWAASGSASHGRAPVTPLRCRTVDSAPHPPSSTAAPLDVMPDLRSDALPTASAGGERPPRPIDLLIGEGAWLAWFLFSWFMPELAEMILPEGGMFVVAGVAPALLGWALLQRRADRRTLTTAHVFMLVGLMPFAYPMALVAGDWLFPSSRVASAAVVGGAVLAALSLLWLRRFTVVSFGADGRDLPRHDPIVMWCLDVLPKTGVFVAVGANMMEITVPGREATAIALALSGACAFAWVGRMRTLGRQLGFIAAMATVWIVRADLAGTLPTPMLVIAACFAALADPRLGRLFDWAKAL